MRKTQWNILVLTSMLTFTFIGSQAAAAPQPVGQQQSENSAKNEAPTDFNIYRVSYRVNQVEDAKTINSRSYTLMTQIGSRASTRIGSQVPYSTGKDIQYQDVGMNIDCNLIKQGGNLLVQTWLNMNTVAGKETMPSGAQNPVFGRFQIQDVTSATIGKPAFVGSIDDVASNRHYLIEVTVSETK
jgi:hypothetical protein